MNDITEQDKKNALQSAIHYLCNSQSFFGRLLQEMVIKYSSTIPTAGISYNKEKSQYEILLGTEYFCSLPLDQREAVLHHELLHFTNKHLFRLPFTEANKEDKMLYNVAGDLAINQYIKNLPEGALKVSDWKHKVNGIAEPFPLFKPMETYYELLKDNKELNKEVMGDYKPFDEHNWGDIDEKSKQEMLEEAKKILKRTIEKTSNAHSNVPNSIKDLLEEIETLSASLNYKQILKKVIKRTVSSFNREGTWKRPNKRYGSLAPGTKIGLMPKLGMYVDSSGSISHTELNEFLNIISNFLKAGSRECTLNLWHTVLYYKNKYKLNSTLDKEHLETGGTDVGCVLSDIDKTRPDLSIILTDGHYSVSGIHPKSEIVWIISEGGNTNHPMRHIGITIPLEGIKE